jgi:predicted HAD superfamily Cof-like phosphohydrolase
MDPYTHICSKVADFNYLFGVIDYNYPNIKDISVDKFDSNSEAFNKSQVKLRFGLINEEIKELEQAINDKNPIEIVDALCDILYVVAGAKAYFNLPIDKDLSDYISICHYKPNNFVYTEDTSKFIINNFNDEDIINLVINDGILSLNGVLSNLTELFINEHKIKYNKLFFNHLIKFYNKTLDNIVTKIFELCYSLNIDIIQLFDIVHNSNMTKVCYNELDAESTVAWYKINELRYKEPAYRKIHYNERDYYVIYDAETKKILKSIKYIPAKFI